MGLPQLLSILLPLHFGSGNSPHGLLTEIFGVQAFVNGYCRSIRKLLLSSCVHSWYLFLLVWTVKLTVSLVLLFVCRNVINCLIAMVPISIFGCLFIIDTRWHLYIWIVTLFNKLVQSSLTRCYHWVFLPHSNCKIAFSSSFRKFCHLLLAFCILLGT